MLDVAADVCGIHAQVMPSAELSLGLRVRGIARADIRAALWQDRTLVKTYGLRGTVHLFPTRELSLWLAALRTKPPPREPNRFELEAVPSDRRDELIHAIHGALDGQQLTREELGAELERQLGSWASEEVFPAFGGHWPRWQLWLAHAAVEGLIVFGPNQGNRVTYVRTDQWLGPLAEVNGDDALREVCRRYFEVYGPATHVEFARWFLTRPQAALELMRSLDLEEVDVDGWRGWLPRGDAAAPESHTGEQIHLLPHFDCYVVGCHPRAALIPESAPPALQKGTAAPFATVMVNGVVGGLWERRRVGRVLQIRVDTFAPLSRQQKEEAERQAARIGEILELPAEVAFGAVEPRGHL